jgi:hypothetical protein
MSSLSMSPVNSSLHYVKQNMNGNPEKNESTSEVYCMVESCMLCSLQEVGLCYQGHLLL